MENYKTRYRYEIRDEEGYLFNAYIRKPAAVAYADRKAEEYRLSTIYIIDRYTGRTIYATQFCGDHYIDLTPRDGGAC